MTTPGKENIVALHPVQLSPAKVYQSPHGLAYDVLIKPASANKKLVNMYSPSPSKDCNEKLKSAEMRREHMDQETQEKMRQKHEKMKAAKCYVLESIENHQKQTVEKVQKKELTAEEIIINQKKELEDKRIAREQRAQEARKAKEEHLESKRKIAEQQLAQLKLADELREVKRQAIAEKAKKDLIKVAVAAQKRKSGKLDEKIHDELQSTEEARLKKLNSM